MDEILCERVTDDLLEPVREFCRVNWGSEHPLVHNGEMFDYYYRDGEDINFVLAYRPAKQAGPDLRRPDRVVTIPPEIFGVCGFIKTNQSASPDVFISYILTKKMSPFGMAFKLIELIGRITGARTLACNNIRRKTRGVYDFLGYTVGDMTHWYRLNADSESYKLCRITDFFSEEIKSRDIGAVRVTEPSQLSAFPFGSFSDSAPFKDIHYVTRRYFNYPWHNYRLYALSDGEARALIVLREMESGGSRMIRVADFIGERGLIKDCGLFLDGLMRELGAEFVDWYSFGVPEEDMKNAGFTVRYEDDGNIIPMYYSPLLMSNVDITVFVSKADGYMMFRADGDQDRPNLDRNQRE